jgi:protein-S-isoprenylcysteine O-methyltransferase Ste14
MNPLTEIPASVRYYVYLVYTLALVVMGAVSIAHTDPDPEWIKKTGDVLQYLGIALGLTAASNITRASTPKPAPDKGPGVL